MLRTPLKNTKNVYVNKPFKSPFESPAQREECCKKARQICDAAQSPLSTRNKEAKRILLLDDNEKVRKRRKLSVNEDQNISENEDPKLSENEDPKLSENEDPKLSENEAAKLSETSKNKKSSESIKDQKLKPNRKDHGSKDLKVNKNDKDIEKLVEGATKNDLQALKRRVFELRQELDCLKSKERCTVKHNPVDLKVSIKKWREACQNGLETLCSELAERNGQSYKISDILKQLNIPETVVHYSEKDDSFV